MGFASYAAYLRSPLWRYMRAKVMLDYGGKCVLCPRRARIVHHLSYAPPVLAGIDTGPLVPLCHKCHRAVEVDAFGFKRTFIAALAAFNELVLRAEQGDTRKARAADRVKGTIEFDFGYRTRRRRKGRGRGYYGF